ncbi:MULTISPECIES: GNAT family N-acetyltransferase [Pseudoalteromonas]|uniref:GNAT family N-acetyltransferase n=1 Tax=Pseudoalteromonas obscura TaxID=3048491 RepID=A0ABT7EKN2_9GAMM|nr:MULTISPECIES: GNAT family N-acetyltransferase [Pseudoalteromonas]MBQ4837158.1 GNAT family N-acetyltransferase [Pseudoalteromonas luteoviolacea]MDK2595616.1 GNAT family N-acetyltransferase [Pseudoalteromonas sp. P94(2023)]
MDISFKVATREDCEIIAEMVVQLTTEICQLTRAQHFEIDLKSTARRCFKLMGEGHYSAIIGFYQNEPIAVATMTETYALYAGGKIGVVQEFYVSDAYRSHGVGSMLIEQVQAYGHERSWSCLELCTPPLPEFERTLSFYQRNGLVPVGGRKMRQMFT